MFTSLTTNRQQLSPVATEALADLLFEIGKDLFAKEDKYLACKWLERAHTMLATHDMDMFSSEATELRLSIIQLLSMYEPGYVRSAQY